MNLKVGCRVTVTSGKVSPSAVSHPVGSIVMGVAGWLAAGTGGRTLMPAELLSGMYTVWLSRDQLRLSSDAVQVELGCAETGKRFFSARDEFRGNLETKP